MPTSNTPPKASVKPSRDVVKVVRLERAQDATPRRGRPRKLEMPPLPQELLDGFTALERQHFEFFIEAMKADYRIEKPSDMLALHMAACEYINLLRVNATSAASGEVITAARQHPGVQLRAWLDSMSTTRRARRSEGSDADSSEQQEWAAAMRKLSS